MKHAVFLASNFRSIFGCIQFLAHFASVSVEDVCVMNNLFIFRLNAFYPFFSRQIFPKCGRKLDEISARRTKNVEIIHTHLVVQENVGKNLHFKKLHFVLFHSFAFCFVASELEFVPWCVFFEIGKWHTMVCTKRHNPVCRKQFERALVPNGHLINFHRQWFAICNKYSVLSHFCSFFLPREKGNANNNKKKQQTLASLLHSLGESITRCN